MRTALLLFAIAACGRDQTDHAAPTKSDGAGTAVAPIRGGELGKERSDCRPDKSCDPGLLCLSNLCVRPPPADCQQVGDVFASFELGNYAEPEARAPVVAKHRAACEAAHVTKEEGKCIAEASDAWTAKKCAPTMFPVEKVDGNQCDRVADAMRAAMAEQMASVANDQRMRQFIDNAIRIMGESCREDGWPQSVIDCFLAGKPSLQTMEVCSKDMPKDIEERLKKRMEEAMKAL